MTLYHQPELTPALRGFGIELIALLDLEDPEDQRLWVTYQAAASANAPIEIEGTPYAVVYAERHLLFEAALSGLKPYLAPAAR